MRSWRRIRLTGRQAGNREPVVAGSDRICLGDRSARADGARDRLAERDRECVARLSTFRHPSVRDEIRQRGGSRDFEVDRVAFMTVEPGEPRGPQFFASFHPVAAYPTVELWDERTDSAPVCDRVSASPAWYRFEDKGTSWQFLVLNLAPLGALLLFAFGVGVRGQARRHASARLSLKADRFFQATCAVALFTVIVTVALWWIP